MKDSGFFSIFHFQSQSGLLRKSVCQEILIWLSLGSNSNLIFLPEPEFLSLFHNYLNESRNMQLLSPDVDYTPNVTVPM